jgi:SAM-dependent methyltransferase
MLAQTVAANAKQLAWSIEDHGFAARVSLPAPSQVPEEGRPMSGVPDRATFENLYAGKAPWDIGRPQAPFVGVADRVVSPVLDAGCGTGDTALFMAGRGHKVTGIDFLEEPIRRARDKAHARGATVDFLVKDATTLAEWDARFATVIDSGLYHVFSDPDRKRYVDGLTHVAKPTALLFLMCFSDEEPGTDGPRRISRAELTQSFAAGWEIESIKPVHIEVNPEFTQMKFSAGGPKAWFATIRRLA